MVNEKVKPYTRLKKGMKSARIKVRGYTRPKRKSSGKHIKQVPKSKLGVIRDPKTGWIIGTYVIKPKVRL